MPELPEVETVRRHLQQALPPVLLSLAVLWAWLVWGPQAPQATRLPVDVTATDDAPPFDAWQTAKGLTVATALLLVFLFTDWPREVAALVGAGVLLHLWSLRHEDRSPSLDLRRPEAWPALAALLVALLLFAPTGSSPFIYLRF